jgi:ketosteroid isomerase-like protein
MIGEIQAFVDDWCAAFNGGDVAGLADFYDAHARVVPPAGSILTESEAILRYFSGIKAQGFGGFSFLTQDLLEKDHVYVVTGRWALVGPGERGFPRRYQGNWINVLDHDERSWRIVVQMWN